MKQQVNVSFTYDDGDFKHSNRSFGLTDDELQTVMHRTLKVFLEGARTFPHPTIPWVLMKILNSVEPDRVGPMLATLSAMCIRSTMDQLGEEMLKDMTGTLKSLFEKKQ